MHQAVTNLTTATNSFLTDTDKFLSPISLNLQQSQTSDALHSFELDRFQEQQNRYLPHSSASTDALRSAAIQSNIASKFTFPGMQPRNVLPGSNPMENPTNPAHHRWRSNGASHPTDSETASAGWIAEEIGRLKITDAAADVGEDTRNATQTPPKLATVNVVQRTEVRGSPLEASYDVNGDSSPQTSDSQVPGFHARGSSTDTTVSNSQESAVSASSQTLVAPAPPPLKIGAVAEVKERPHSFSGGLSSADLKRLQQAGDDVESHFPAGETTLVPDRTMQQQQQQQWATLQYRDFGNVNDKHYTPEQLVYPSLATESLAAPRPQLQHYEYRHPAVPPIVPQRDEQADYSHQHRAVGHSLPGPATGTGNVAPFVQARANNAVEAVPFRQPMRGFAQQGLAANTAPMGYAGGHHTTHLSLGNTQQLYDMMLSGAESHHPAVTRVQQQHNVFRATHQHSASDPSSLRDAATLALLSGNMQAFTHPGIYPPPMAPPPLPALSVYPNQFYAGQDTYAHPDVATQVMAARLQAQYTGPYNSPPDPSMRVESGMTSPVNGSNGPSANNRKLGLYKTELCRSWEEKGSCRYGTKCQFAHGEDELRKVTRHPKYKTEICRTFWVSGSCPYGKRCCFIHTELPTGGGAGTTGAATENSPTTQAPDGRARSMSTNSDPNDSSVSLLARISAKRGQEGSAGNSASTPVDVSPPSALQFNARPPTGSLRVDTTALDNPVIKQNKSAYPTFASNGVILPAAEQISVKSPIPVTAGPDLGRHNASRLEIVGYNQQRLSKATNPHVRHSFNGTEVDLNLNTSPPSASGPSSSYIMQSATDTANYQGPRPVGHIRSGSAGNWGNLARTSHLAPSPFPQTSSPGGEAHTHTPWSTTELTVGSSRLHETWA